MAVTKPADGHPPVTAVFFVKNQGESDMNRTSLGLVTTGIAATLLALSGCGGGNSGDPNATGILSIGITDAPVDEAAAVVIAMTEFEFKPADEDEPPFRVAVEGAPRQLNLIDFTDGAAAIIIDGEEVPAGDYEWMRIYFDESLSYVQLETDGTTYPLFIPSGAQTGYKLVQGFSVPVNNDVTYMLDFDVRKSLIEPPGLGLVNGVRTFLLKPAIRLMNVADTGSVSGAVDPSLVDIMNERCLLAEPPLTGNAVYVFDGMDAVLDDEADPEEPSDGFDGPVTSDVVDLSVETGDYEYHLMFLLPGTYTLAFTCSAMADGASDDDYPDPADGKFDFDAQINVDIVSNEEKTSNIPPPDSQPDPC
jgi:hypothetical protein